MAAEDYSYNPFNKDLRELVGEDLKVLTDVSEGWYIEYKRIPQDVRGTAKTITAFANQYGGMLFFGITESNDGSRVATKFTGIPSADVARLSLQLREASSAHASPAVYYEEAVIKGPCDEIGLLSDHAIVVVGVPQGLDAPYVHSSGRIYRRVADQSAPKEETDRHVLDLLWERGRKFRERVVKRLRNTPELPAAQVNAAIAFIYLVPDLRHAPPEPILEFDRFRELAKAKGGALPDPSMPMDAIYSRNGGYTARQVANNNPKYASAGFHWWHGGIGRIDVPLSTYGLRNFRVTQEGYEHAAAFVRELDAQRHADADICDFSMLVLSIVSLVNLYNKLRESVGDRRPLYATFELRNVLYKVPFFNSGKYIARCREDGIPVITDKFVVYREEPYFDNMFSFGANEGVEAQNYAYTMTAALNAIIMNSVGIAPNAYEFTIDPDAWRNHHAERKK